MSPERNVCVWDSVTSAGSSFCPLNHHYHHHHPPKKISALASYEPPSASPPDPLILLSRRIFLILWGLSSFVSLSSLLGMFLNQCGFHSSAIIRAFAQLHKEKLLVCWRMVTGLSPSCVAETQCLVLGEWTQQAPTTMFFPPTAGILQKETQHPPSRSSRILFIPNAGNGWKQTHIKGWRHCSVNWAQGMLKAWFLPGFHRGVTQALITENELYLLQGSRDRILPEVQLQSFFMDGDGTRVVEHVPGIGKPWVPSLEGAMCLIPPVHCQVWLPQHEWVNEWTNEWMNGCMKKSTFKLAFLRKFESEGSKSMSLFSWEIRDLWKGLSLLLVGRQRVGGFKRERNI